jgi:hypothetical protein
MRSLARWSEDQPALLHLAPAGCVGNDHQAIRKLAGRWPKSAASPVRPQFPPTVARSLSAVGRRKESTQVLISRGASGGAQQDTAPRHGTSHRRTPRRRRDFQACSRLVGTVEVCMLGTLHARAATVLFCPRLLALLACLPTCLPSSIPVPRMRERKKKIGFFC